MSFFVIGEVKRQICKTGAQMFVGGTVKVLLMPIECNDDPLIDDA